MKNSNLSNVSKAIEVLKEVKENKTTCDNQTAEILLEYIEALESNKQTIKELIHDEVTINEALKHIRDVYQIQLNVLEKNDELASQNDRIAFNDFVIIRRLNEVIKLNELNQNLY